MTLSPKVIHWPAWLRAEFGERLAIMLDSGVVDAPAKAEAIIRGMVERGQIVPGARR